MSHSENPIFDIIVEAARGLDATLGGKIAFVILCENQATECVNLVSNMENMGIVDMMQTCLESIEARDFENIPKRSS